MIDIKDISGNIRFSTPINQGSKRKFLLMKEDYITLKFSLDKLIPFSLGDNVDHEIGMFELVDLYKPDYNIETGAYEYICGWMLIIGSGRIKCFSLLLKMEDVKPVGILLTV